MTKATEAGGTLNDLGSCYLDVTGFGKIDLNILPDISDTKSVTYNDEPTIGRTTPIKTYAHSDNRTINVTFYFIVTSKSDIQKNISYIYAIQSAAYPRDGSPYKPPPVCKFSCGNLIWDGFQNVVCVVLKSYDVKYNKEYPWDESTFLPYYVEMSTTWDVVYDSAQLPGQERILSGA